jgi:putative flippase GtrA
MSGRHALPSRLGYVYREIAKFGAVGLAGVVVNVLAFNVIRRGWGLQTVRASVIATLVAIVCNYIGFRYFTYRDRGVGSHGRELTLFVLFSLVGLAIENSVLYTATYGFGWDSQLQGNFFKFVGIGVATLFRFWSYRTWVFGALPARSVTGQAESVLVQADQKWAA